jgi:Mn2+/Fe2+ NRAMP family transporter
MAAAGVGAGDVTMASLGGAQFGLALLWAPLVAAVLKFALNEGLARYQLATGETLLEGWAHRLGPAASIGFLIYLIIWTVPVFAALASTSGVAMDLLLPIGSLHPFLAGKVFEGGPDRADVSWSIAMIACCFSLVWLGRYALFERVMAWLTIVMFGVVILAGVLLFPVERWNQPWSTQAWWPANSGAILLSIMGGTGSTVGVMAYSYWMRERGRQGAESLAITRLDLMLCYLLSGLFGTAIMALSGGIPTETWAKVAGLPADVPMPPPKITQVFEVIAHRFNTEMPVPGGYRFEFGTVFKAALAATVISSLLGMMQSIPYLYGDLLAILGRWSDADRRRATDPAGRWYRLFLVVLTILPIPLVVSKTPTFILMIYAIWGSLFIPFLAATLLLLNNRSDWVGPLRNRWGSNIILLSALVIFGWTLISGVWEWIATGKPPLPSG